MHQCEAVFKVDNLENLRYAFVMPMTLETKISRMPTRDRATVRDLANALERHKDQGPASLARLMKVTFDMLLGNSPSREQKLARATIRGTETRQQLKEAEGGSISSEEAADLLEISKTAVLKRLAAGNLLAWRSERLNAARFPRWQFTEEGSVLPGMKEVLAILNQGERLDTWAKILFFLQAKPSLRDRRPLDLLRVGELDLVIVAAQAYAE